MAILGSSVDPRLFMQDYSGFTRAAEIQAQGMQNLGASIGGAIESYADAKEKRKKIDASTKASRVGIESAIKLGEAYGIDVKSSLEPILAKMDDPNTTPMEAAMYGEEAKNRITNVLSLGIDAQEREIAAQKANAEAQYKQGMLGAAQTRAAASLFSAKQAAGELKETEISIFDPEIGKERKEKALIDKQGQYYDRDTKRPILDTEKYFYGEEGGLGELPPTSQVGGNKTSQFTAPTTYYGLGKDVNGPDEIQDKWTNQGYTSTGKNLTEGVAAVNTQKYPLGTIFRDSDSGEVLVAADSHGNKDPNVIDVYRSPSNYVKKKENKSYEVIGQISREQIPKTPSGIASLIEQYSGNQSSNLQGQASSIDNALAMGGDMTRQAMGTPEQQAEAARQMEQATGMAMAQNIPQGAIPTDPSMATQQPQLPRPQRRMVRGIPANGGKAASTTMTAEQVKNLVGQGFRVSAMPNPDGTFMVNGVTTAGASSGFEVTTPEGTTVRYGGSGGLAQPKVSPGEQLVPDPTSPTGTRVVQIPGGEAEKAAKQEASAAEAARKRAIELGSVALAEIDNFINYTDRMSKLPLASPARKILAAAGMEKQSEAESSLATVAANIKFEALDALRKASPTGASGLGQVTQTEFQSLSDQWGALRLTGDPEKIKERAIRIKKQLLDVVHGDQAHRDALLKTNVITKQQYDEIQSQYPNAKQASREDINLERWRKSFTPQPTQ